MRIFQLLDRVSAVPNGSDITDPFKGGKTSAVFVDFTNETQCNMYYIVPL